MDYHLGSLGWGSIEVVCGPMFSGKTEELIRRVRRAQIARQSVQIFKPHLDNRYHEKHVVSHSSLMVQALALSSSLELWEKVEDSTRIVAIDEVQFFDENILVVIKRLVNRGIRIICAGLDQDYRGEPFGVMPDLLCIADRVDKIQAICTICGSPASKTYRSDDEQEDREQVLIGGEERYQARCFYHWNFPQKKEFSSKTYEKEGYQNA